VEAAVHDSLAAEHGLRAAKSAWFPNVGLSGNFFSFHPQDPINLGLLRIDDSWHQLYLTNLKLSYPIYAGGRRTNQIRLSRENVNVAASNLSASRLAYAYRCRQAYLGLLIAGRILRTAEASRQRVEIILHNVENLYRDGLADSVDILETQISFRQVERRIEESRTERRNASASLARLLGVSADATIIPTDTVATPSLDAESRLADGEAAARRPELATLDHRILAAGYQRSIVKASLLPVINGQGGHALVRPEIGDIGGDWKNIWFLGLSFSWDVNLGGQVFSESKQALEAMRALEMQRSDLEESLVLQAQIAWNNLEEAYRIFAIRAEELELARRRYRLAEGRQSAGQMTVNRLLELEAELTETEQQLETSRLRFFAARNDYLYAIGSDLLREGL
jgi:outer membrane protein TolC